MIVSKTADVAKFLGKSVRTVQRLIRAGMPVMPGKKYDLQAISAWLQNGKKRGTDAERKEINALIFRGTMNLKTGLQELTEALLLAGEIPRDELEKIFVDCLKTIFGRGSNV